MWPGATLRERVKLWESVQWKCRGAQSPRLALFPTPRASSRVSQSPLKLGNSPRALRACLLLKVTVMS